MRLWSCCGDVSLSRSGLIEAHRNRASSFTFGGVDILEGMRSAAPMEAGPDPDGSGRTLAGGAPVLTTLFAREALVEVPGPDPVPFSDRMVGGRVGGYPDHRRRCRGGRFGRMQYVRPSHPRGSRDAGAPPERGIRRRREYGAQL